MNPDIFSVPDPLPETAVFVGPASWLEKIEVASRGSLCTSDPTVALATLRSEFETSAHEAPARVVMLHQDAFAGPRGTDDLEVWLRDLAQLRGPHLPVLLHGRLGGDHLVRFFRAGLFDALEVPLERTAWVNMLIRAERRLEQRQQSRLVLASAGETHEVLRTLRRRLGAEAAGAADELLRAQESLEAANRQLNDAMAELSLLHKFGRRLSTAHNWDDVLREILQSLGDFVGAGGAALVLRSAPGGSYAPRQTWQWEEGSWDRVLVSLQEKVDGAVAESIMAPGVFRIDPADPPAGEGQRRIIALPMEHQDACLGFLLLLFTSPDKRDLAAERFLPFLQAVQVVLAEEVAGAQLLDRIRGIGAFNARVLETVRSGIWVLDAGGRTVFANRAGQTLLTGKVSEPGTAEDFLFRIGRGRGERPLGAATPVPEVVLDGRLQLDDHDGLILARLRGEDGTTFRGEGRITDDDGHQVPVLVQTSPMPGRGQEESWLVIVVEDLRESRIIDSEKLRSDRLEGLVEMSATLAHEIRNPLMGLSAQAELLAEHLPDDDPRCRYLDVITREVERINATISRMLNFVRPYEPNLTPTDLDELAADAVALARPRAVERQVNLVYGGNGALGSFDADGSQLKQVILNLVFNAIDAAPVGGRVEVVARDNVALELDDTSRGTRRSTPGLVCEVRDDGPGVAEADRERIFRPFYTTKSSGTGLGLSVCHKIVAAHGGEISVHRDGDETVFRVALPAQRDKQGTAFEEEAR